MRYLCGVCGTELVPDGEIHRCQACNISASLSYFLRPRRYECGSCRRLSVHVFTCCGDVECFEQVNSTSLHYDMILDFMKKIQELGGAPVELKTLDQRIHRADLIYEECVTEAIGEGLGLQRQTNGSWREIGAVDRVALLDGVCDSKVVLTGTLVAAGLPDNRPQLLVDLNNLQKFRPGFIFNTSGKLIKPPDHVKVDLEGFLKNRGLL